MNDQDQILQAVMQKLSKKPELLVSMLNILNTSKEGQQILQALSKQEETPSMQIGGKVNQLARRFNNLSTTVTNEKGYTFNSPVDSINSQNTMNSQLRDRVWTINTPTPYARINNTTNQSDMTWNPGFLPDDMVNKEKFRWMQNPEGKGLIAVPEK